MKKESNRPLKSSIDKHQVLAIQFLAVAFFFLLGNAGNSQVIINEGSNKNYSVLLDEDGDHEDWIEIYNSGSTAIDLFNYSLSDNSNPGEWLFPHQIIQPDQYIIVFCSGKDRFASFPFTNVLSDSTFVPQIGWNPHYFSTPFYWDGISNIILNLCTYNPFYQCNSIHSQSATSYNSATIALNYPGSACGFSGGSNTQQRPNIRFNSTTVGTGTLQNGYTDYPSAYSNWYEGARQQYLYTASELVSAGLSAGNIDSLAFDVIATCPTNFQLFELSLANTGINSLPSNFIPAAGNFNHTNFKISSDGETISLFNPSGALISTLEVDCGEGYDISTGAMSDGGSTTASFATPTPGSSNNASPALNAYTLPPIFTSNSGIFTTPISVSIFDANVPSAAIYYTLDGSDPDTNSTLWNGTPIFIFQSTILRAKAFKTGYLPSVVKSASYLFNVSHTTPIISVISDPENLYGPTGMFDNPSLDLLKTAAVDYFDATSNHNLLFTRRAGIVMDGGWAARSRPKRAFRIKFNDNVLGQGPVSGVILPDRPNRSVYSDFYLRNGSNMFLTLPFKDAVQTKMMGEGTNNYYSASQPVSVYINGTYWGLYDLREKFDTEMFEIYEGAAESSIEILSSSAQYGFQLRAVEGDVQNFYSAYESFNQLNPTDTAFWNQADQYFDMKYYNDYIIGEVWMNNVDWCLNYNNLKIYRSNATNNRWRYCLMDLEYGLLPNDYSIIFGDYSLNCSNNLLAGLLNWPATDPNNPHINIFLRGLQNDRFRNYFINRFADQMNSVYLPSRLLPMEEAVFNSTVAEMPKEFQRWGDPNNVPGQMNAYYQNHLMFMDDLACRPENMRNHLQSSFNLPQQVQVNLEVYPADAGQISISTLKPETYPWQGIYFDGVPIKIEAQALSGYVFSHWESNAVLSDTLNPLFNDTLSLTEQTFKAHFISTLGMDKLNNKLSIFPNPAEDFVTLQVDAEWIGSSYQIIDISGKLVQTGSINSGQAALNLSKITPGIYFLKLQSDAASIVKIVKL